MKRDTRTAREVLDRYRAATTLDAGRLARIHDRLLQRVASGEVPQTPSHELTASPQAAATGGGLAAHASGSALVVWGVSAALLVAGAVVAFAIWHSAVERAPAHAPAAARPRESTAIAQTTPAATEPARSAAYEARVEPRREAVSVRVPAQHAREARHIRAAPPATPLVAVQARTEAPAETVAPEVAPRAVEEAPIAQPEPPKPTAQSPAQPQRPSTGHEPDLEQELPLIRNAYAALHARQPARALALLAQHAERFPHGALAESRDVARIMALCDAGNGSEARREAKRFLLRLPNSPSAARVRTLCPASAPSQR